MSYVIQPDATQLDAIPTSSMIPFVKAHANGNDFLIIDDRYALGQHAALAQKLCARNTSVGADGIEFLDRRADGSFFLRLFNADGSEAELSGNGTRCVAAWLAHKDKRTEVVLGTHGGPRACEVISPVGQGLTEFYIRTEMGIPQIAKCTIDVAGVGSMLGIVVNAGNPHFVLFVEDESFQMHNLEWQELGAILCIHPVFPQGTNVEFVYIRSSAEIDFRIYERGCGPTKSSGTGTCASAAAAIAFGECDRELIAYAEGGMQKVVWPTDDASIKLTGPASIICVGKVAVL